MRPGRLVASLFAVAAIAALLVGLSILAGPPPAFFLLVPVVMAVGLAAFLAAVSFGLVAYVSFRGGALGQLVALAASALLLVRVGPYFARIVRRGDDITWLLPVGAVVALLAIVAAASAYGLWRGGRRRRAL